jgi:hypothetical protein
MTLGQPLQTLPIWLDADRGVFQTRTQLVFIAARLEME